MTAPSLRYYQADAVEAVHNSFKTNRSTLVVKATGLGKSVLFSRIASDFLSKGKVLCLAHRTELVNQAAEHILRATGERVDIEQAEQWASIRAKVVSASIQTLSQPKRLTRFAPDHFALVIADEAHHYTSPSFKKILDYFTGAKVLGVTATPDRADEKALGKVFDDVAYVMDIVDGIEAGYLVPIKGQAVLVSEIDISNVSTSAGDLAVGELDDAMVRAVEGVTQKALELGKDRQGVWFWPGVKSAELAADRINALEPGSAGFVSGETDKEERQELIRRFKRGELKHLVNCAVFTEGFDAPATAMVVMARPTKSRMLYAQCAGRGTRPLPGVTEFHHGKENSDERRKAIAASRKPDLLLLDFYGNSGKHTLCSPEDILGGDYSEEEVKLAKEKAKETPGQDVLESLAQARCELKAMMAKIQSKVKAQVHTFSPFETFGIKLEDSQKLSRFSQPASKAQIEHLVKFGMKPEELKDISKVAASKLINNCHVRMNLGLASYKQLQLLRKHGVDQKNLSFKTASKIITYISSSNWRPDPAVLQQMVR